MTELKKLLMTMEVPENRLDLDKRENLLWLLRNLQIRNSRHPDFETAIRLIRQEVKNATR